MNVASMSHCRAITFGALFGALLLTSGCSDTMTSPTQLEQENSLGTSAMDDVFGRNKGPAWIVVQEMHKSGGQMELDGDQVVMNFPSGALPLSRVTVTAKMRLDAPQGTARRMDIELQPSMQLKKPVTVQIDPSYLAGGSAYALWSLDTVTRSWTKVSEQAVSLNGTPVTFQINRFATYAVTR
jgi:hypothetical protein